MSSLVIKKDKPPDYNSVIKLKEREDQELPTYSEAVSDNTGDINETEDVTDDTKHDKISDDKKDDHAKCDELSQVWNIIFIFIIVKSQPVQIKVIHDTLMGSQLYLTSN